MITSETTQTGQKPSTHDPDFVEFPLRDSVILGDPRLDNMMTALTALSMEMWTLRRRMLTTEAVLANHGIDPEEIEIYEANELETAEWKADRDRFLKTVFGCLGRDGRNIDMVDLIDSDFEDPAIKVAKTDKTSD